MFNKYSSKITQNKSQGASQAMLYGCGLDKNDMQKPQIGIASMWYEGNTCNMHLFDLANHVKNKLKEKDLIGLIFNTIGVSDGISMGTSGMNYSLQSRDLIADSIETVMQAHHYDGCIAIPGCDKNMPGSLIAMIRINKPAIMLYGGTINAGNLDGQKIDIVSAFQSYGEYISGKIDDKKRLDIVKNACPGPGACGGMYTANTMACIIEALGFSLPFSSSTPAIKKTQECADISLAMKKLIEKDIKPKDILTLKSFENALTLAIALGGSTNMVLHVLAIAKAAKIDIDIDFFQKISDKTPLIANLKPSGKYVMADLHEIGGVPAVMKMLLNEGLIHGDQITVNGESIEKNLKNIKAIDFKQDIIRPISNPIKKTGHIQILKGNLAPDGAVAKITGKEGEKFRGTANVFESEQEMIKALENGLIKKGDVIVIRYQGPKGGPGMPEMLKPTSAVMGAGLGKDIALITDGRFSGGSHGFIVGHICPEAQLGGPIALIQNGDIIDIDITENKIEVLLSEQKLKDRQKKWTAPDLKADSGTLFKYIKNVSPANFGCVTDI